MMNWILVIAVLVFMAFSVTFRCAVLNLWKTLYYFIKDTFQYTTRKGYNNLGTGELIAYVGLFGRGKTLSAVKRVVSEYHINEGKKVWCEKRKQFVTQRVKVLSNVQLKIPYEHLKSLEQVVLCAENNKKTDNANGTKTITLVLGDEFAVQMSHRDYKKNINALLLNAILTCRHHHISIFYTAQRFAHVDALLRQVTSYVVSCDKFWRFQRLNYYDAWEMENAQSPLLLKPLRRLCWFVRDADYNAYDTLATVDNLIKAMEAGEMMDSKEILDLQRNNPANMDAVQRPNKGWLKRVGRKK
jgi:hypothetical protein